ncbi:MAG: hypothetical protein A3B86_02385 [Candidatus Yanofskybacteria bacterium RIFCSPHIGHO2_02_FULL_38_22b]|uniref:Uncharacterized protein n=1 Tax=Candidatus Yanofskybacteria bacterium RIFCSPHIGHO2_02_FULL_38_22b TaxID=1802673 RepID=A0A1F8F3F2_9BACT|nr:MAG: hypothetical protein A3B86_02385 [Candidatus Yanofskybacteria bacterium RIFCSPHIGHO2_02_FULL_38_22b]OGN20294.1 MAG: hypothetical protein A2910_03220 [Candidatus Yanofskybacteria bacterium RIFCSPLOWO2_01_FULL_39_28]
MSKKILARLNCLALIFGVVICVQAEGQLSDSSRVETMGPIKGVEITATSLNGWFASITPWHYLPKVSTVHPVAELFTPGETQTPGQMIEQIRLFENFGSGADILHFNVCLDYNHWLANYLSLNTKRPFFVLYEHIHGNCNYVEPNGSKNMSLAKNRQAFMQDIEFFIKNIILPNQSRYVTVNGRAVIYMWAPTEMRGDFASLLDLARFRFPVFFIGSVGVMNPPTDKQGLRTLRALDGFMEYGVLVFDKDEKDVPYSDNYLRMIQKYDESSGLWYQTIKNFEKETRKKYLFIPTFQAAYDDTKYPGRTAPPMYPRSRAEMEHHAEVINRRTKSVQDSCPEGVDPYAGDVNNCFEDFYDNIGPHVVATELPEGAAVIESQCLPETVDILHVKFVGCGTGRLEIVGKYFGK